MRVWTYSDLSFIKRVPRPEHSSLPHQLPEVVEHLQWSFQSGSAHEDGHQIPDSQHSGDGQLGLCSLRPLLPPGTQTPAVNFIFWGAVRKKIVPTGCLPTYWELQQGAWDLRACCQQQSRTGRAPINSCTSRISVKRTGVCMFVSGSESHLCDVSKAAVPIQRPVDLTDTGGAPLHGSVS
jgi:hypothetical protein